MMRTWVTRLAAMLLGGLLIFAPVAAYADTMTAADVVALGQEHQGESVRFEGEAIGDVLRATGDERWVNILSGGTAIGVVMSSEEAGRIAHLGRYGEQGTKLAISGTFHFACPVHGGDLDVHADEVGVLAAGGPVEQDPGRWKLPVALGLLAVAAAEFFWFRRRRWSRAV